MLLHLQAISLHIWTQMLVHFSNSIADMFANTAKYMIKHKI